MNNVFCTCRVPSHGRRGSIPPATRQQGRAAASPCAAGRAHCASRAGPGIPPLRPVCGERKSGRLDCVWANACSDPDVLTASGFWRRLGLVLSTCARAA